MSSKSMGKSIGTNIRKFRMEKGISQETLASALYVTRQTVSNYETGRSQPDLETLQKLSTLLDVEVTWLLYGKPEPGASKKKAAVMLALAVLASVIVTIRLCRYTDALFRRTYDPTPRLLVRLVQVPLCMTFLGAAAMQGLDWSIGVGQVRKSKFQTLGRRTLVILAAVNTAAMVPFVLWCLVILVKVRFGTDSISMTFPYIPVYQQVFSFFLNLMYAYPFVYCFLGAAGWLVFAPGRTKE